MAHPSSTSRVGDPPFGGTSSGTETLPHPLSRVSAAIQLSRLLIGHQTGSL